MPCLSRFLSLGSLALALGLALAAPAPVMAAGAGFQSSVDAAALPKVKQTPLGLYLTARDAARVLATHDDVVMIDVRTPEETDVVGYATVTDANIPIALFKPEYEVKGGDYVGRPNPDFVPAVKAFIAEKTPSAMIIICRSGHRSAAAVRLLAKAGIDLPLYEVVDGIEGAKDAQGHRTVDGWKNAGLDWTYDVRPDLLRGVE